MAVIVCCEETNEVDLEKRKTKSFFLRSFIMASGFGLVSTTSVKWSILFCFINFFVFLRACLDFKRGKINKRKKEFSFSRS